MTQAKPALSFLRAHFITILYLAMFIVWVFGFDAFKEFLVTWFPGRLDLISRTPLPELALQHLQLVALSTGASILVSLLFGIAVHLSRSVELESLVLGGGSILETIPSAAIIALSVPLLGYGNSPVLLALWVYAILPVLRNVIVGLRNLPPAVIEAAQGVGMTPFQRLIHVELPLARPMIMAGIKTALVINISVATIGATVGAGGFGVPIIAGIRTFDSLRVLQGSVAVILLALFTEHVLR
ncbi:MAG: ABC transporter permease [Erysipelotrichales bacterium]|nr:MAG: ABC transporter permease [Erysipelotrichales bacterium]